MAVIKVILLSVVDQYRKGFSLFWLGPAVVALIVIPEFIQHIAEIQLGMFESREAARAIQNDSTRLAFGYVKIAGLILAFLASARFWWCAAHGGKWYDLRNIAWGKFLIGLILFIGIGLVAEPFAAFVNDQILAVLRALFSLLSLPFLFLMLAGLFNDQAVTATHVWKRGWPFIVMLALLLVLGFGPAQYLHGLNHKWAFEAPSTIVWALMIFDSLVVGLLASLVGAGIAISYMAFRNRSTKLPV